MSDNRVYIFDTTLRDGQQSPGAGMSFEDNIYYAQLAHLLGIDILEAGFPSASQMDFSIVNTISQNMAAQNSSMMIAALSQLREEQIIRTLESLAPSLSIKKARLHTYVPVDPNLMHASLGKLADNKPQILNDLYRLVSLAVKAGYEVQFSPEGYSRMGDNFDFTTDLIRAALSAGASIINCPDTIGGAARIEGKEYFVQKMNEHASLMAKEFPGKAICWSAHCHNDFGLALDNSIQAVTEGPARQIEGCINGVGERAGNVALEQCIIYFREFGAKVDPINPFYTNIHLNHLKKISDFIAHKMLPRQPHFPIVGDNATRHSSGGHTNAILKNPLAYQPFDPKDIGSEITFAFGPLSGGNHANEIIKKHGYRCEEHEKAAIAQEIKQYYATRRKGITDQELIQGYQQYRFPIKVHTISISQSTSFHKRLTLSGQFFEKENIELMFESEGSPLMALVSAIKPYLGEVQIIDYSTSVEGVCTLFLQVQQNHYQGQVQVENRASDPDRAELQALIHAINLAYVDIHYKDELPSSRAPEALHG